MLRCAFLPSLAGLLLTFLAVSAEEKPVTKGKAVSGDLTKVEAGVVTITSKGDKGESSEAVKLANTTKILLETADNEEVKGEGGKVTLRPKTKEGAAADLKVGQKVTALVLDGTATQLTVRRPTPPKPKEGEKN